MDGVQTSGYKPPYGGQPQTNPVRKEEPIDYKNYIIVGLIAFIVLVGGFMIYSGYKETKDAEDAVVKLTEFERGRVEGVKDGIEGAMIYIFQQVSTCQQVPLKIPPNNETLTLIAVECLDVN